MNSYNSNKVIVLGLAIAIMGIAVGFISIVTAPQYNQQDMYAQALPCANGELPTGDCYASESATIANDIVQGNNCIRCLYRDTVSFNLPGNQTGQATFGRDVPTWTSGTPADVRIWDNAIVIVTVQGRQYQTLEYPVGSVITWVLLGLGGVCVFGGILLTVLAFQNGGRLSMTINS